MCLTVRKPFLIYTVFAVLLSIMFLFFGGYIPTAVFCREHIKIGVFAEYIAVEGKYLYKNPLPFPVTQHLYTPFPVDGSHPFPYNIDLTAADESGDEHDIAPLELSGKLYFNIRLPAKGEVTVRLYYRQRSLNRTCTYILKTTRKWGRPLEKAVFEAEFFEGTAPAHINYGLLPAGENRFKSTYFNFMPENDIMISWE